MNIDKFEERMKDAFESHHPDTDNDAIWENIEPHLKKKKKRRAIIFFFWGLGLGLLLLFLFRPTKQELLTPASAPVDKSAAAAPRETTAPDKTVQVPVPEKTVAGPRDPNSRSDVRKKDADRNPVLPPPADNSTPAAFAGTAKNNASKGLAPGNRHSETVVRTGIEPKPGLVTAYAASVIPTGIEPGAGATASTDAAIPNMEDNMAPVLAVEPTVPEMQQRTDKSEPETPAPTQSVPNQVNPEQRKTDNRDQAEPVATEKITAKTESAKTAEKADKNTPKDKKKDQQKKSKKRKFMWEQYLSAQAGPGLALRKLSESDGMAVPAGYLAARQSSERSRGSYTVGFFYSMANRKGLVLKAGLDYRQANEKFHEGYYVKETLQLTGVLTMTVNGSGDVIAQTTGPKTVTKTTEYSYTAYNRYRFVNLPVGAGYRFAGKKSHWEFSGGVDVNLFFRANCTIYEEHFEPVQLDAANLYYKRLFRRHNGLGLWAMYGYGRKLTDHLSWQVSANAQIPMEPITRPGYELVQRYFNFGVQAGVVYQIGQGKKR